MKRSKIKGKWIWGVLSTTLAIIFLFSVKMTAVYAAEEETADPGQIGIESLCRA